MPRSRQFACFAALLLPLVCWSAAASDYRFNIEIEAGATWQEKNDVQIPNDRDGDRFSLEDIAGSGPWGSARINFTWDISGPHGLRAVPLLYFAGEYQLSDRWQFRFDFDGLAGGPGRAIDLGLKLSYEVDEKWRVSVGYCGLEGGVDSDDVYNFAWFNTALIAADYRW